MAQWKTLFLQCRRCEFDPLVLEDPLQKEMATHSSIHAWEILWAEEPGWLQTVQKVRHVLATKQQQHTFS